MEQRKTERVQFFQLAQNENVVPVWVFHRAHEETLLGLLLDAGNEGVQVLTDKSVTLDADGYRLLVHADDTDKQGFLTVDVKRVWSKPEGTLYTRHGFTVGGESDRLLAAVQELPAVRETGRQWLRCEIEVM